MSGSPEAVVHLQQARRMQKYEKDIVFVNIPYERMHNLVTAVPECSAGTAELDIPPEMQRVFEEND
jgi:hypothetical protein